MGSQVSSDVCRSFLALRSSHCLEPQVRHVRSFLYTCPPLADEDTKDGRDLLQRHCPTFSWQSSAYSLPCWGCLLRSWGAELLPLLETLHGSWVRETPVLSSRTQRVGGKQSGQEFPWKVPPRGLPLSYSMEGLAAGERKLGWGGGPTPQARQVRESVF